MKYFKLFENFVNEAKSDVKLKDLDFNKLDKIFDLLTSPLPGIEESGYDSVISTYIEKAIENDFSGNVIDVCPVGALTDKTFRFKNRVWFTKPVDAHRDCPKCKGKVTLWYKGEEVLRVTGRKDQYGEVEDFICNTCRFDTKNTSDWVIEGPRHISHTSVISSNHYEMTLLPVIKENPILIEANKIEFDRATKV